MVAQFSSRLRDNQTLLGLHVWGNAAALDSHGYVVPVGGGYADRALAHAQGARGGGGGGAANAVCPDAKVLRYPHNRTENVGSPCWMCGRWREERFEWTPTLSHASASYEDICLHLEVDGFRGRRMAFGEGDADGDGTVWALYRMVPPGLCQYFFSAVDPDAKLVAEAEADAFDAEAEAISAMDKAAEAVADPPDGSTAEALEELQAALAAATAAREAAAVASAAAVVESKKRYPSLGYEAPETDAIGCVNRARNARKRAEQRIGLAASDQRLLSHMGKDALDEWTLQSNGEDVDFLKVVRAGDLERGESDTHSERGTASNSARDRERNAPLPPPPPRRCLSSGEKTNMPSPAR